MLYSCTHMATVGVKRVNGQMVYNLYLLEWDMINRPMSGTESWRWNSFATLLVWVSICVNVSASATEPRVGCRPTNRAHSNSRYASHSMLPLATWIPTAVSARSNVSRAAANPPSSAIPPIQYWTYSSHRATAECKHHTQQRYSLTHNLT